MPTHVRLLVTVALALLAAVIPGTAFADEAPIGNAHFRTAGVAVYDIDAPGTPCRVFGFCGPGFTAGLHKSATPRLLSQHAGAAVRVDCQRDHSYRVSLFAEGDTVIPGWADTDGIITDHPILSSRCV